MRSRGDKLERQRKMALVNRYRHQDLTPGQIAKKTGLKRGTVSAYIYYLKQDEAKLAKDFDPGLLAKKRAEILAGLEQDLQTTLLQIKKSQKGYKSFKKITNSNEQETTSEFKQVNEMAITQLIKLAVDIRMKIANLLGISQASMVVNGNVNNTIEIITNMPAPTALIKEIPITTDN